MATTLCLELGLQKYMPPSIWGIHRMVKKSAPCTGDGRAVWRWHGGGAPMQPWAHARVALPSPPLPSPFFRLTLTETALHALALLWLDDAELLSPQTLSLLRLQLGKKKSMNEWSFTNLLVFSKL